MVTFEHPDICTTGFACWQALTISRPQFEHNQVKMYELQRVLVSTMKSRMVGPGRKYLVGIVVYIMAGMLRLHRNEDSCMCILHIPYVFKITRTP